MMKRLSIQVFAGESYPLTLRHFALQALRIKHITCQVQGGTALKVRSDTESMRSSTKLINRITRGEPDLLCTMWTDLTTQLGRNSASL
jgi:hypothetical protein